MKKEIKCETQQELEDALKNGQYPVLVGDGYFKISGSSQVTACDSSQVRAYGSSQVTACDSSQVTACDSSQVRAYGSSQVTAYDSSQVRACDSSQVRAYDSSQVRAYGSSQVTAYGSSQVTASKYVAVTRHGDTALVDGGVLIQLPEIRTPEEWCEFFGLGVKDEIVVLYKGVSDDYKSPCGADYTPGTTPIASDWDGGSEECGGGLHFSPRPFMTLSFNSEAKRFVACPVKLSDIAVHYPAQFPEKVKARGCGAPVWEVDIDGNAI